MVKVRERGLVKGVWSRLKKCQAVFIVKVGRKSEQSASWFSSVSFSRRRSSFDSCAGKVAFSPCAASCVFFKCK